jgi:UDPglucose--hexose-1-phosphate uridylyltransferase
MTPPQTLVLPETIPCGSEPQGDRGWGVRVVPNLYPALDRQEVVIHSPDHVRSLAELADHQLDLVAEAWQRRRTAEPTGYMLALINEGRDAGASLPHSHSQLAWLPGPPPPEPRREGCTIEEHDGLALWSPRVARVPYETAIAPTEAEADGLRSERLGGALRQLAEVVRRLRAIEGPVPFNAWLHNHENGWRVVLFPRLTILAALEVGAGIYVNTLAPEEAAQRLRAAA